MKALYDHYSYYKSSVPRESILAVAESNINLPLSNIYQTHISQFIEIVSQAIWTVDANLHWVAQDEAANKMIG
jgi:hypothetical protein